MKLQLAEIKDLTELRKMYHDIIQNMKEQNIDIWDDVYPSMCFEKDIQNKELYILVENKRIIAAFTLCKLHAGENVMNWETSKEQVCYIDRLGVHIAYQHKGIGSQVLAHAMQQAKALHAQYLRLFVVDFNIPAINLYVKCGFHQVEGIYDDVIDEQLTLHELGFEIHT